MDLSGRGEGLVAGVTLKTRTWTFGDWDREILAVLLSWNGVRVFRRTLHAVVRARLAHDPVTARLVGPGSRSWDRPVKTWLDRHVVNLLIMLDRAGLIERDDVYIHIRSRPGIQRCLDVGTITYSWEKEDHV